MSWCVVVCVVVCLGRRVFDISPCLKFFAASKAKVPIHPRKSVITSKINAPKATPVVSFGLTHMLICDIG
jgi:hypothetical protein